MTEAIRLIMYFLAIIVAGFIGDSLSDHSYLISMIFQGITAVFILIFFGV